MGTDSSGRALELRRGAQLGAGLVLYALSVAALVRSGLGNMPWDVLSQGMAHRLSWSLGTATIVLSVAVLLCWIPLRQRPGIGTAANVVVIGVLIDPFMTLLGLLPDPLPVWGAVLLVVGGIAVNGLATALYIGARLGPGPRDGLMTGLVARTGWPVRLVRSGIEVLVVLGGWLLGGTVGLGTLAYALAIGPLAHVLMPQLALPPRVRRAQGRPGVGEPGTSVRPGARPA